MSKQPSESYARLYYRFAKEFPKVYADDHQLAAWVRLLMLADASWPLRPPMPRSARTAYVKKLIDAGLVILDGDGYTVLGLDAERTRRSNAGKAGADARWHSDGNATSNATAMPRRDETSKDKPSSAHGAAIFDRMMKRRLEWFGKTGEWDPEWGPLPAEASHVA